MARPARLPLRGREHELGAIRKWLTGIQAGTGGVMVVEGSAGSGKTRLLDETERIARDLSFRVGRGSTEPGRVMELGALFDAIFEGDQPLADRRNLTDFHASQEFLFWLLQDIQSLIEEAALQNPLLICLDDLHRAGPSCARAIRQLPSRLASLPVAWVMTFRPDQGAPTVQNAKQSLLDSGGELVHLGPVDRAAVAQIAADILGAEPDAELLEKAERVQGNPFLLVEFFRGLQDDLLIALDEGRVTLVDDRLPHRVSEGMRARLGRMSSEAQRVATFAASLGRRFTLHDVASMTDLSLSELVEPIDELIQADLFADDGDRFAFRHDLIRDAVRGSLLAPVRRALDRHAADVLLARGALPIEVAAQLTDSADLGDDNAIKTVYEATQALSISDPASAAELAAKALELTPVHHPLRGPLVAGRVVSLFAAGLSDEGKQFAESTLRQALSPEEEARVRFSVASMFDLSLEVRAENARAGLALASMPDELRAQLWAALYHSLTVAGRVPEALNVEETARQAAYATNNQACWTAFDLPHAGLLYQQLKFHSALEVVTEAESRELDGQEDVRVRLSDVMRIWTLEALDRCDEAIASCDIGIMAAQRDRQNWALGVLESTRGRLMLQLGGLAETAVALEGRFNPNEAQLVAGALHAPFVVALGDLRIHTGDEPGALEVAEIARAMMRADAPCVRHQGIWFLAKLALSQGDAMQAYDWLCALGREERLSMWPLFPHEATYDVDRVRIATAVADHELAEHAITIADRRAELNPGVGSAAAAAAHVRGVWRDSIDKLEQAESLYRVGPRPMAHASALEDVGRVRALHGDDAKAIEALDEALSIATRVGATWDAARVRRRLRRLGVRRRPSMTERPKTGWASLTDAEKAVAHLAVEGNTNRQIADKLFISPHTVNTHLRHVFEKLGINSRMHLRRFSEHGPEI
jgi:DNA-binding CsgD family transcriptional regulator